MPVGTGPRRRQPGKGLAVRPTRCDDAIVSEHRPNPRSGARGPVMSTTGTDSTRGADQEAEQAVGKTATPMTTDGGTARPADADGKPDSLLALLRPPQA